MGIAREDLHKGGKAFYRVRQGGNGAAVQSMKLLPVTVKDWNRGAAIIEFDHTGKRLTVPFNQLEPDDSWLESAREQADAKAERIRKEALEPFERKTMTAPLVRLVEESKPLTASFAELLKHKDPTPEPLSEEARTMAARFASPAPVQPPPPPKPPAPPAPPPGAIAASLRTPETEKELAEPWDVFGRLRPSDSAPEEPEQAPSDSGQVPATAQRIYDLRVAMGWTQHELARKCIVTRAAVSHWEVGLAKPQSKTIKKLAKAFGVSERVVECIDPIPDSVKKRQLPIDMTHSGVYAKIDTGKVALEQPKAVVEPGYVHIPAKRPSEPPPAPAETHSHAGEIVELPPVESTSLMPVPKAGFDMWLEMGRRMREPLQNELGTIDASIKPLEQRLLDMMERKAELEEQLAALDSMLSKRPVKVQADPHE